MLDYKVLNGVLDNFLIVRSNIFFDFGIKGWTESCRLGDRFREHLRDVEKDDKDASKPVVRHFNLPNHSKEHMSVCGLSLHRGATDSRKNLEQRFIFQIGTLFKTLFTLFNLAPLSNWHQRTLFIQLIYSCFSRDQVPTNSVAPSSVYKAYTTHNSSIYSDEGLTLETSAFQSLYGGQLTLSTPLIKQIFVMDKKNEMLSYFLSHQFISSIACLILITVQFDFSAKSYKFI